MSRKRDPDKIASSVEAIHAPDAEPAAVFAAHDSEILPSG
jgi:hypothetical protein